MLTAMSIPGFHSPAAGFDEPMEVLAGCHERMRRSLALLGRLAEAVADGRRDEAVRSAAADVQRYFDRAAPAHHDDEERWVFPLVLARSGRADVRDAVQLLAWQHLEMGRRWARLREGLAGLHADEAHAFGPDMQALAQDFISLYERHAEVEDRLVFPEATALATPDELQRMGADMAQRRGVRPLATALP